MELIGTVHNGRVLITLSTIEQPRVIRVQAFIVAHDSSAQHGEAREDHKKEDSGKQSLLTRDRR